MAPVLSSPEPVVYFGHMEYSVDESAGSVAVHVWRAGTDLSRPSSVTLRSQKTDPPSAHGEQRSPDSFDGSTASDTPNTSTLKHGTLVFPNGRLSKIITVR